MNLLLFASALIIIAVLSMKLYQGKGFQKEESLSEVQKWYRMAITDDLTKTKNRTAYSLHINEIEKKKPKNCGIILLDIDHFKKINDDYGHLAGDDVLKTFAIMLEGVFSENQYSVYRIGGDEFAILAENITEHQLIEKLLEIRQFEMEQRKIRCSKGYSMISKREKFNQAFVRADEMLYADKLSKKKIYK